MFYFKKHASINGYRAQLSVIFLLFVNTYNGGWSQKVYM